MASRAIVAGRALETTLLDAILLGMPHSHSSLLAAPPLPPWTRVGVIPGYALSPDGRPCDTTVFWKSL